MRSALGWSLVDVTFGYGSHAPLYSHFDFTVAPGSLVHIAGPSGAGKTSLIALMTGEAVPSGGRVVVKINGCGSLTGRSPFGRILSWTYTFPWQLWIRVRLSP